MDFILSHDAAIFAVFLMWIAQQCRVVQEFAYQRPDQWRFSRKWLVEDQFIEVFGLKWYINSPVKWFSWGYMWLPITAAAVSVWGAMIGLVLAILTFDVYFEWLYVKPSKRGQP